MNEVEQVFEKYFSEERNLVNCYGEKEKAQRLLDFIEKGKRYPGDAPDMVIETEDRILAIEHFEIDCYVSGSKGSKHRIEKARINRTQKKIPPTEDGVIIHDSINGDSSYKSYVKNVEKTFREHYGKIAKYTDNIRRDYAKKDIIVCFLIEDVSPLGTMVCQKGRMEPVVLGCSSEFLNLLKNSKQVDYVMACSEYENNKYIWVISNEEIDEYLKNAKDYANMDFMDFKPRVSIYKKIVNCGEVENG
jgi:hypothetical protein